MFIDPTKKLIVVVTETRYDMIGVPTIPNKFRAAVLKQMGGVSDTVPPGTYVLDVRFTWTGLETDLRPLV